MKTPSESAVRLSTIPRASGADRRTVSTPGTRINQFEVKIDIGGQIVADTQSGHLLDELIIGFAGEGIGNESWGIALAGGSNASAETDVVTVFRPYAEISSHPKIFEI